MDFTNFCCLSLKPDSSFIIWVLCVWFNALLESSHLPCWVWLVCIRRELQDSKAAIGFLLSLSVLVAFFPCIICVWRKTLSSVQWTDMADTAFSQQPERQEEPWILETGRQEWIYLMLWTMPVTNFFQDQEANKRSLKLFLALFSSHRWTTSGVATAWF